MVTMPINIAYANAKQAISSAINETINQTKLPMFLLEQILKDLHDESVALAKQEMVNTEEEYQKALKEEEEAAAKPTQSEN